MIRKATKRLGRPPLVENRRETILVSAAKLFGQVGYDKCSMRDISDATNVSKGTLYHYFKTKQEIYDAIFLNTLRRMVDFVSGAVDSEDGARRKLEKFFRAHAEYFDAHYWEFNATMLGLAGVSSSEMRHEAIVQRDRYEDIVRQVIRAGIESGEFKPGDPGAAARAALSLLNWMPRWYRPDGPKRAALIALEFCELLLEGLASPKSARK